MITGLKPGDVLCIADNTKAGYFIRLRGKLPWMRRRTPLSGGKFSHVAVVMHTDKFGLPWGIEGKPSNVEFVELTKYLKDPDTLSNRNQPKTDEQRQSVVKTMLSLYAVKYDWRAIGELGVKTFGHSIFWLAQEWKDDQTPDTVICSSSVDGAYERAGLQNPGGEMLTRQSTPDDWGQFILENGWGDADGRDA